MTQAQIRTIIARSRPERLSDPGRRPIPEDHAAHVVQLAGWGHCALAADHLLFPEITGRLPQVVGAVIRQLGLHLARIDLRADASTSAGSPVRTAQDPRAIETRVRTRQWAYHTLLEMALNFMGMESRWLDDGEKRHALAAIRTALEEWEAAERAHPEVAEAGTSIAAEVVRQFLHRMKLVQKGTSMVAHSAIRIEQALDFDRPLLLAFLDRARAEIEGNVYTRMVRAGVCRFGNDYALGLRWLRHLGFEQVSTNPVLAALAYQDDPDLGRLFQSDIRTHPRFEIWRSHPERYADEIALHATLLALWDNLHVFRPIFFNLAAESGGGVVSFQLNPNIAHLVPESLHDVLTAIGEATADLRIYDDYLLAGYPATRERARPNMVIKVAASTPAAREIARTINSLGIGSNITVSFSAAQQVTLILEEMAGMATAVKKGIVPTQLYMTNMGGRFESHLRETKLEEWFARLRDTLGESAALERLQELATANGTRAAVDRAEGYQAKVVAATRYAHQRTIDARVMAALREVASEADLKDWEEAIGQAGTLVARRVWGIFFSPHNRGRWLDYLCRTYRLTREQAGLIMSRIHYLPASKRKPEDTYWTLAGSNMVHTEFPNHQENVRRMADDEGFHLEDHLESVTRESLRHVLDRLNDLEDFRAGYELTPELTGILRDAGIEGEFGSGGCEPTRWPDFGPVRKTLAEFTAAYNAFRDEVLRLFKEIPGEESW
jgi:hypothetical protein